MIALPKRFFSFLFFYSFKKVCSAISHFSDGLSSLQALCNKMDFRLQHIAIQITS